MRRLILVLSALMALLSLPVIPARAGPLADTPTLHMTLNIATVVAVMDSVPIGVVLPAEVAIARILAVESCVMQERTRLTGDYYVPRLDFMRTLNRRADTPADLRLRV